MDEPSGIMEKPLIDPLSWRYPSAKPQAYYDAIKQKSDGYSQYRGRSHRGLHRLCPPQRLSVDRPDSRDRRVVGPGDHQASGKDQPEPGLYARLLQLRGRVQPPPGRELQRRVPPLRALHAGSPPEDGRALCFYREIVNKERYGVTNY